MSKPLIEIHIVSTDGNTKTKTTFDFDMVMGVSPFTHKIRDIEGRSSPHIGCMLMLKNNREIFVIESYETITDQWIKLTHPCSTVINNS